MKLSVACLDENVQSLGYSRDRQDGPAGIAMQALWAIRCTKRQPRIARTFIMAD